MRILRVLIGGTLFVISIALIVTVLWWILQTQSVAPAFESNSRREHILNMAKSNAGLVPTNMLLSAFFCRVPQLKLRRIKLGYGYEKERKKAS